MSIISGSLMGAIAQYYSRGHKLAALLIDEQEDGPTFREPFIQENQVRLLEYVRRKGIPVIRIEFGIEGVYGQPTFYCLRGPGDIVLKKVTFGAFANSTYPFRLNDYLLAHGIGMLIVLGYATGLCVRTTCVGTRRVTNGEEEYAEINPFNNTLFYIPGANALGYVVLTSELVLYDEIDPYADWKLEPLIRFYTGL